MCCGVYKEVTVLGKFLYPQPTAPCIGDFVFNSNGLLHQVSMNFDFNLLVYG